MTSDRFVEAHEFMIRSKIDDKVAQDCDEG